MIQMGEFSQPSIIGPGVSGQSSTPFQHRAVRISAGIGCGVELVNGAACVPRGSKGPNGSADRLFPVFPLQRGV